MGANIECRPAGILALQGDFELHERHLDRRGEAHVRVRRAAELDGCSRLIIPGGESTTMSRLLDRMDMRQPVLDFAASGRPVLGTCAGLILLSREVEESRDRHGVEPLGLLDVLVRRNGYGTQIESFVGHVDMSGEPEPVSAAFIRAPMILEAGPEVEVIATRRGEPVGVRQGNVTGLAFHPEVR